MSYILRDGSVLFIVIIIILFLFFFGGGGGGVGQFTKQNSNIDI